VCGNLSAGEGGGIVHLGEIQNGDIEHNAILLNESSNPTIPTNGGGIMVQGTPDTDPNCPGVPDSDCAPGLSDGTGRNLVINANLIQANSADSGAGGGIRLSQVNGTEVSTFPNPTQTGGGPFSFRCPFVNGTNGQRKACLWNDVSITNNIIVNNLAGWDGAGISLQDSLNVSIVNNTIAHNDSLASSGVLTQSIGTPMASGPAANCTLTGPTGANTASCPQPSGISSTRHSSLLTATFVGPASSITCPSGETGNGCRTFSNPVLANNIIWQNRSFQVGVNALGTGTLNQQKLVTLYNASFTGNVGSAAPAQTATGVCPTTGSSYWDIGVRGDTGPTNHAGGRTLNPTNTVITSGYSGQGNSNTAPPVVSQYCNGSRVPPECSATMGCGGPKGFGVPPGIADALTPNPVFSLNPSATVDEGNNWINVSWGPLSITNPATNTGTAGGAPVYGSGALLANYNLTSAFAEIPANQPHPATDYYGNARPEPGTTDAFDPGAIEFGSSAPTGGGGGGGVGHLSFTSATNATPNPAFTILTFTIPTPRAAVTSVVTITNTGTAPLSITAETVAGLFGAPFTSTGTTCSFTTALAVNATCTVNVRYGTPAAPPLFPNLGALSVANNGSGTFGGNTNLVLVAQ
jgi:hypothetical protein